MHDKHKLATDAIKPQMTSTKWQLMQLSPK